LRAQGRYAHLFKKGAERSDLIAAAQRDIDDEWRKLKAKAAVSN
jgi:pyruvate ferredoxin oxidoreductase beta subunit